MQHIDGCKNVRSHGNRLVSSPLQPEFNILVIFSSKNIKQNRELDLTYFYACWIMQMGHHWEYQYKTSKVARKTLNIGKVWTPVCCHGNKNVKLVLWSTLVEYYYQESICSSCLVKVRLSFDVNHSIIYFNTLRQRA